MASKFSLKSSIDKLIYIAPVLVAASLLHIFSTNVATHNLGQIEILAALIIVGYYLWDRIEVIYAPEIIWKKRIEAVVCLVVSIFLALVPLAPLMTWQYFNLYKNSDRYSYKNQIIAAIATVWIGVGVMYYSSYTLLAQRMAAQNQDAAAAESSYVAPTQGQ